MNKNPTQGETPAKKIDARIKELKATRGARSISVKAMKSMRMH